MNQKIKIKVSGTEAWVDGSDIIVDGEDLGIILEQLKTAQIEIEGLILAHKESIRQTKELKKELNAQITEIKIVSVSLADRVKRLEDETDII